MESVKKENERILRAQEELNQILTEIFHTEGRCKRADSEDINYQHVLEKISTLNGPFNFKSNSMSSCVSQ